MAMTLSRRMTMQAGALIGCVIALGAVGLWGVAGQASNLTGALGEYRALRESYELASRVTRAQVATRESDGRDGRDLIHSTRYDLMKLAQRLREEGRAKAGDAAGRAAGHLAEAVEALRADMPTPGRAGAEEEQHAEVGADTRDARQPALGSLNTALNEIGYIGEQSRRRIAEIQADATRTRSVALWLTGVLTLAIVAAVVELAWRQRRAVMAPLLRLSEGVRRVAAGRFQNRVEPSGDAEFVALAGEFNHMAGELDALTRGLEARAARAGKELARAERLASVGFLAAGVAHEINNPLAIVSGHAELALRALDRAASGGPAEREAAARQAHEALAVVRDEVFRCKEITGRLLELARPGDGRRVPVDPMSIARQVAALTSGLPRHQGKRVSVVASASTDAAIDAPVAPSIGAAPNPARDAGAASLIVMASPDELRQVLLNLTLNALEAVAPSDGAVTIEAARAGAMVRLVVRDNGAGMTAPTLSRVFEPFYSERGGEGLGLGLSIVQAIVTGMGGRVSAASDGPGKGSEFTIELPAAGDPA